MKTKLLIVGIVSTAIAIAVFWVGISMILIYDYIIPGLEALK